MQQYPESVDAWLTFVFINPGNVVKVNEAMSRAIRAVPYSPAVNNLRAYGLMWAGQVEEAIAAFEGYVKLRPAEGNAFDGLAEAQLVAGNLPLALSTYQHASSLGYPNSGRAVALAMMGRYEDAIAELKTGSASRRAVLSRMGRYTDAERELATVEQAAIKNGNDDLLGGSTLMRAAYSLERGDCANVQSRVAAAEQALHRMPEAWSRRSQIAADLLAGTCDARTANQAAARARLAHAQSMRSPGAPMDTWWTSALAGEIALAEGRYADAAQRFAEGEPARKMYFTRGGASTEPISSFLVNQLILRDGRARAAAGQRNLTEAIALYRGLLTPGPKNKWTAMPDPLHALALARLLDKAGQRDAARVEYQRFLDWWKTADRDLPQLAEAQAKLK